ncbi:unnamed protein product [Coccothraustes coccothraustes]
MRQECEDCGVRSVLEGERLNYGLARAGWSHTLKDKLLSQGQGTPRVGEKRAPYIMISSSAAISRGETGDASGPSGLGRTVVVTRTMKLNISKS